MAMTKCHECKKDISTTATACPHCGAKPKPKTSGCAWLALIFIAIPVVFGIFMSEGRKQEIAAQSAANQARAAEQAKAEAARLAAMTPEQRAEEQKKADAALMAQMREAARRDGLLWNYTSSDDEMGRGKIQSAIVKSLNEVDLPFPYNGAHPEHGRDVIFFMREGQINCRIRDCTVLVRFGDGKPEKFSALEPSDNSTETIFFQNYERFLAGLRKSEKVSIEVEFFQAGNRVFEFDTSGLEWK
jgi:hypothetical protein